MFFSDKITLRTPAATVTAGFSAPGTPVDVEVFADAQSVYREEHYSALAAGRKVERTFVVHAEDYSGQMVVVHESKEYRVERAPAKGLGDVVLICSLLEA